MKDISLFLSSLQERLDGLGEKGQGMVEYALILAAVAIIAVVAIWGTGDGADSSKTNLQQAVVNAFNTAAGKINEAQKAGTTNTSQQTGGDTQQTG